MVLGHVTWACLLRREALAFLSSCYAFVEAAKGEVMPLWDSVRRELWQIRCHLPLLAVGDPLLRTIGNAEGQARKEKVWSKLLVPEQEEFQEAAEEQWNSLSVPQAICSRTEPARVV